MYVIGTDEAGYGPNYGPLVVSATIWQGELDSFEKLSENLSSCGIRIGDSKNLYHGGGSIAPLEYGILIPLRAIAKKTSKNFFEFFRQTTSEKPIDPTFVGGKSNKIPLTAEEEKLESLVDVWNKVCETQSIQLVAMKSKTVFPTEFNERLKSCSSKGSLLSDVTLRLVLDRLKALRKECNDVQQVSVLCDKHGGRNHYLDLLTEHFPGEFVQVVQESRAESVYRLSTETESLEFRFIAKGESRLPIALASMLSKYLRELAMIRFNEFWQAEVPDLKPTAGYPEDARRFKQDIAAVQKRLGIDDADLWRNV